MVTAHLQTLTDQLARIMADGVTRGEFATTDPEAAGRAVLHATARFHHPAHAAEWADPRIDADFDAVWTLIHRGLTGSANDRA